MTEKRKYVIDGAKFDDFSGFIAEFNRMYVIKVGGLWNGNLDAFNDYLAWDTSYVLKWRNSEKSRHDLGHKEMAIWLEGNLTTCHPLNQASVRQRLQKANRKEGQTMFGFIVEIILGNSDWVDLRLD